MRSKFLRLNSRDFVKGLIVVVICTFLTGIYQLIVSGGTVNWLTVKPVVIAVAGSAISYLTKNLLTNSQGDFMKTETGLKTE
jgi:hypothetical protein